MYFKNDLQLCLLFYLFIFWWYWGLNARLRTCKAGTLAYNTPPVHFALGILYMRIQELFAQAGLEPQSS
jgi:hypothetical protein